jgi:hypothetical protein
MALKREGRQVDYKSQIGVNRGQGFADLAQASLNRATQFDKTLDRFAGETLNAIQNISAREGAKEGELYDIQTEEKTIINPNTGLEEKVKVYSPIQIPKSLRTRTSIEAFEKSLYKRYENEILQDLENIAVQESNNAINNNFPLAEFDAVTREKYEAIYENLSDTVLEKVARSNGERLRTSYGSTVNEKYLDRKRKADEAYRETISNNLFNTTKQFTLSGVPNDKVFYEYLESLNIGKSLGDAWTDSIDVNQQIQTLIGYGTLGGVLKYGTYSDPSKMSYVEKARIAGNLDKIQSILSPASGNITVELIDANGEIRRVSKEEIINTGLSDATLEQISVDVRTRESNLDTDLTATKKHYGHVNYITSNNKSGTRYNTTGNTSNQLSKEIYGDAQSFEFLVKEYSRDIGIDPNKVDIASPEFVKFGIDMGIVNPIIRDNFENAFSTWNPASFKSIEPYLGVFGDKKRMYTDTNGMNKLGYYSPLDALELPNEVKSNFEKFMVIAQSSDAGYEEILKDFQDASKSGLLGGSISDKLDRAGLKESSLINMINDKITDVTGEGLFTKGFTADSLSSIVLANIKLEIEGDTNVNKKALDSRIDSLVRHNLSDNGVFGVDEYTYGELLPNGKYLSRNTFSNKFSMEYRKGNKIVTDAGWVSPYINELARSSYEYNLDVLSDVKELTFGENILLQPMTDYNAKNPLYRLIYINDDGVLNELQNEDGSLLIFNPMIKDTDGRTLFEQISNTNLEDIIAYRESIEAEQERRRGQGIVTPKDLILSPEDYKKAYPELFEREGMSFADRYLKDKFPSWFKFLAPNIPDEYIEEYTVFKNKEQAEEAIRFYTGKTDEPLEPTTRKERRDK